MSTDMGIDFCGERFRNPFLLAASPATGNSERIKKAAKAGWGGVVTTTVWARPGKSRTTRHPRPNFWIRGSMSHNTDYRQMFAFQNIGSSLENERWIRKEMKHLKEVQIPVIGSIMGSTPDDWPKLAHMMESEGANMLEVNVSCPYLESSYGTVGVQQHRTVQRLIGQDPQLTRQIVKLTKEGCNIPIIVKLPGGITPSTLSEVATAAESAGADAISVTNTILGLLGIDVETGIPIASLENKQGRPEAIFSGISGPAVGPIALRCVAQISTCVKVPVSGIGGVTNWKSAVEFLMAGAKTVQCATAPLLFGYEIVRNMIAGLQSFMKRKGYASIEDFRGISLKYLGYFRNLEREPRLKAIVDGAKCIACAKCIVACGTGGNSAIKMESMGHAKRRTQVKTVKIMREKCYGCGLCLSVCPKGAISLINQ
jgi:dihydropyrimidine dehydrogenase (NAD+) subunit PreA